jgi:hypothetical protein
VELVDSDDELVEDGHLLIKSIEIVAETSFAGKDYAEKHPEKGSATPG